MQKYGKDKNKGRSPKVCVRVGLGFDIMESTPLALYVISCKAE